MAERDFNYAIWKAELEEDKIRLIQQMLRSYREKFVDPPNLLLVRRGMFKNIRQVSMIFGCIVLPVDCLAECRDPPYVSGEMVVAFARITNEDPLAFTDNPPEYYVPMEQLKEQWENLGKRIWERIDTEVGGPPNGIREDD